MRPRFKSSVLPGDRIGSYCLRPSLVYVGAANAPDKVTLWVASSGRRSVLYTQGADRSLKPRQLWKLKGTARRQCPVRKTIIEDFVTLNW